MRRVIIAIGLAGLVLWIAPLALADIDSNSIVNNGLEYYIQTNKSVYDLDEDEDVEILYRVTNLTNINVVLQPVVSDPLAYYDFRVTQGDNQIWRYPYMSGATGFTGILFSPYESKEFQTVWNLMNDNGTFWQTDDFLVSPGNYDVVGEVALILKERNPVSVSIGVIPEPSSMLLMAGGVIGLLLRNKIRTKN
jgi:hypothetical protein